jgi:hypothetical protein
LLARLAMLVPRLGISAGIRIVKHPASRPDMYLPVDFVKALLNHNDKGLTGVYARWHMFEVKR